METVKSDLQIKTKLERYQAEKDPKLKKTMSVPEMRRLLGVKKTESYWLVHRNFFKTEMINGRMRVDIESFEKWYANQIKHKKVTGEAPGEELRKKSYSIHDVANLLGVHDSHVYEFVKKDKLETVTVDFAMRIPIDVFEKWYDNQIMFQKVDKLPTIADLEADYIRLSEAAELLGITREKLSMITRASRFKDNFEIRVYENKKWISKKSFQHFLNAQNVYQVNSDPAEKIQEKEVPAETKEYISKAEAVALAGVTTVMITKWAQYGKFSCVGAGRVFRIHRNEFLEWLKEYREEQE